MMIVMGCRKNPAVTYSLNYEKIMAIIIFTFDHFLPQYIDFGQDLNEAKTMIDMYVFIVYIHNTLIDNTIIYIFMKPSFSTDVTRCLGFSHCIVCFSRLGEA